MVLGSGLERRCQEEANIWESVLLGLLHHPPRQDCSTLLLFLLLLLLLLLLPLLLLFLLLFFLLLLLLLLVTPAPSAPHFSAVWEVVVVLQHSVLHGDLEAPRRHSPGWELSWRLSSTLPLCQDPLVPPCALPPGPT